MIIGVYGYIGTGKTSACEYLQNKYYFIYLSADKIAKEIMQDSTVLVFLEQTFPGTVINGVLDRTRLRTIIFTDPVANTKLNNYLWPKVNEKITTIVNNNSQQNFLIEAISLNTLTLPFKAKVFITVSKPVIIDRIVARDQQSPERTKQLLKIQKIFFKQVNPDYKITTNNSLLELYQTLDKIMEEILGDEQ